ncbi:unnamed protein product [Ambrosiozyma monospora]|uniref:Unnamed protein product n=1 Tax=Ambrosiozyma monospora TaxID=43982 RepID=A0A9W7DME0_AMBMO|nr:unnamed protein product [Ambrosiozyma monospora]
MSQLTEQANIHSNNTNSNILFAPSPVYNNRCGTTSTNSFFSDDNAPPARATPLSSLYEVPATTTKSSTHNYRNEVEAQQTPIATFGDSQLERRNSEKLTFSKMNNEEYKRQMSYHLDNGECLDSASMVSQPAADVVSGQTYKGSAKEKLGEIKEKLAHHRQERHHNIQERIQEIHQRIEHDKAQLHHHHGHKNEKHAVFDLSNSGSDEENTRDSTVPVPLAAQSEKQEEEKHHFGFGRKKSFSFNDYKHDLMRKTSFS